MHRDDRPALIALALMLCAILILAFIENAFDRTAPGQPAYSTNQSMSQDSEQGGMPPSTSRSTAFNWLEDTLPQWIVAVFTVIAAGISFYAVRLVDATLRVSKAASTAAIDAVTAANAANDLMRQDQRPWVGLTVESMGPIDIRFNSAGAYVAIRNMGQTPALDVGVAVYPFIVRSVQPDAVLVERLVKSAKDKAIEGPLVSGVIYPGNDVHAVVSSDYISSSIELDRQFENGPVKIAMIFICTYRSSRAREHFHTSITALGWENLQTSTRPFDMEGGPYGIHNITFEVLHRLTSAN